VQALVRLVDGIGINHQASLARPHQLLDARLGLRDFPCLPQALKHFNDEGLPPAHAEGVGTGVRRGDQIGAEVVDIHAWGAHRSVGCGSRMT
jgi:hypothetical protein